MTYFDNVRAIKSDWQTLNVSVSVKPDKKLTSWLVVTPYGRLREALLRFAIRLLGGYCMRESFETGRRK